MMPAAPAAIAGGSIVVARVLGLPISFMTGAAFGLVALVILIRLPAGVGVTVCMSAAAFCAAATLRSGRLDLADVLLVVSAVLLWLRGPERTHDAPRTLAPLIGGIGLISVGGLVGRFFDPGNEVFSRIGGYRGSSFAFVPPEIADVARFAIFTAGLLLLARAWQPKASEVAIVLKAFGGGVLLNGWWGAVVSESQGGRVQGLASHPVEYGMSSAFGLLVGVGLMTRAGTRRERVFGALVALAGLLGVLNSGTRSALVVAAIGVAAAYVGMRSIRRVALVGLATLLALGVGVLGGDRLFGDTSTVQRLSGEGFAQTSDEDRAQAREETYALIRTHGITGAGFRFLSPPHSLLLGVIAAAGILGLLGLILIVTAIGRAFVLAPRDDPLPVAVLAGVIGVYSAAWVVNQPWDRWMWLPTALVLGCTDYTRQTREAPADPYASAEYE